ncbi:polyphosphate:nucleotide phosphotransferase, PPK2 family [Roseomonas rosea]|uniref:Polyphosphate:nucleotide phosphotransferase, PPK2 family n=1 Tax=Muricoccus roseus TaxID=198092 RepID=A0A1M6KC33_9PROT|nr:PPK2 family polyphosphate kinase [Roseomonas rosea]SHJ56462.1 polyphosphate:nucleotide phosphotransferase, PPK2 family [Roseomonas rosea]
MPIQPDLRGAATACRVTDGALFSLADRRSDEAGGLGLSKKEGEEALAGVVARISAQQERLYADARWSVLCILQGMDASGKDGAIKHVFSGVNPQGVHVESFSAPSTLERSHGYLWRHDVALPRRGRVGVHNRSWYEEVLVPRVQPSVLQAAPLPANLTGPQIWAERLEDIAAHERYLSRQGMLILKFYLHLGEEEQRERLLARIDDPAKNWKFQAGDLADRARRGDYVLAYDEAIRATAAPHAPWFIIPADRKWLARLLIAEAVAGAMESLDLQFPSLDSSGKARLLHARDALS